VYIVWDWNLTEEEENVDIVRNARQHIQSSAAVVSEGEDVQAEECEEWKKALERIEIIHSNAKQISAVAKKLDY